MTLDDLRKPIARHPCVAGALFWIAFSAIAIVARGVQWDENYEFAQVILGQIPYPSGHPLYQYVRGFYSLQTYSLAALMYFFPEPLPANFLRNWIFLSASTVPVFLLGALFSRKQIVGHIAVVFILLEIHSTFYSTYPVLVWPMIFSNGAIGLGYMLLALWALVDHRNRLSGLMIGLAPAVHLGQFPPLLLITVLVAIWRIRSGQRADIRTMALYALPGLTFCACFALFIRWFSVPPPVDGPYYTAASPTDLLRTFMTNYPGHRSIPYTTGHLVLIAAMISGLALLAAQRTGITSKNDARQPVNLLDNSWTWAMLYCASAACIVWGIMSIHYAMGPEVPHLLIGWLPYRLMNHVAPVLVPMLIAIGYARDRCVPAYLVVALLAALLTPLADLFLDPDLVHRYIAAGDYLFFYLAGGAAGTGVVLAMRFRPMFAGIGVVFAAALIALLACFHQFGAVCTLIGFLAASPPLPKAITPRTLRFASAGLVCLLLVALLGKAAEHRQHLYRSEFHRDVEDYLLAENKPDAMILVHHDQAGDQMLFGHPVMADMATMLFCAYRPAIAPAVNAIFQDFYGIYLDPAAAAPDANLAWYEVWPNRSLAEWQRLSAKYKVEYVAAPAFMRLPLELVLRGQQSNLFRIPPARTAGNKVPESSH